jgi:hypothetical protein
MAVGDAIDPEWLDRRRRFCEARILAWTRPDRAAPPSGVVAGLEKELAAIALLQGDLETARARLVRTGELLLAETSAQGLVYLGIAGAHRVADDPVARTIIEVATRDRTSLVYPRDLLEAWARSQITAPVASSSERQRLRREARSRETAS